MKSLTINNLSYYLGRNEILKNINFNLHNGEILSIIGPSGSGKTTILRLLAGLLKPSEGEIILANRTISCKNNILPTGDRNIGLMFQEDVLFPHLTVYNNIAFGLHRLKEKNKSDLINKYIKKFELTHRKNFYPENLSGGEKQRVSLARILITNPKILLMDEPFSSLDNKLRWNICNYTMSVLKEKKISVIFVTHDVKEALRVSDRVMVVKDGRLVQIEKPERIYKRPKNKFVAKLFGEVNELEQKANSFGQLRTPFGLVCCKKCSNGKKSSKNKLHSYILRPEDIILGKKGIPGIIVDKFFLGSSWEYNVMLKNKSYIFKVSPCKENYRKQQSIGLSINLDNILIFQE